MDDGPSKSSTPKSKGKGASASGISKGKGPQFKTPDKKAPKKPAHRTPRRSPRYSRVNPDLPGSDDEEEEEEEGVDGDDEEEDDEDEHIDDDDPDEDNDELTQSKPTQGRKQKKKVVLPDIVEEEMVNWVKDNPVLYNKGAEYYKRGVDKKQLWADKAKEVGIPLADLQKWYETNRTRYGKISKRKSGDGARQLTPRQQWVLKSFDFLKDHINRLQSRAAVDVSIFILLTGLALDI